MDWIEILFGLSPDNGNGTAEWLIIIASLVIGVTVMVWLLVRRSSTILPIIDLIGLARLRRWSPPGNTTVFGVAPVAWRSSLKVLARRLGLAVC